MYYHPRIPKLNENSIVSLHHLFYIPYSKTSNQLKVLQNSGLEEANPLDAYAVVRKSTDDTILINQDGLNMIKLLASGHTVKQIANQLKFTTEQVESVIHQLIINGFVEKINEVWLPDHKHRVHPWFIHTSRKYFRFAKSRPFLIFCWLFIFSGLSIGFFNRSYWPHYDQFFWHKDPLIVVLSLVLISNIALVAHEIGHFVVTKAFGGEARISFDYRYLFLVAQTSSYYVNYLPLPQRLLLYLAGMIFDLFTISFIYWLVFLTNIYGFKLSLEPLLFAVILVQIQGVLWQYNLHLETDIYNVFSDFIEFENLRATVKYKWVVRLIKLRIPIVSDLVKKHYVHLITEQEHLTKDSLAHLTIFKKRLWNMYNLLLILGLFFTTFEFLYLILPRELQLIDFGINWFIDGVLMNDCMLFFKSILLFILILYKYFILVWAVIRNKAASRNYGLNPFESI